VSDEKSIDTHITKSFSLNEGETEIIDKAFGKEYICDMGLLGKRIAKNRSHNNGQ
jgi:hypothetical protein